MATLPTSNPAFGFWGTIAQERGPEDAWEHAMQAIATTTGCPNTAVRDFLDSRHGRHLADDVCSGLAAGLGLCAAIDAAVERWMGWRIGRRIERETGIPRDLPYLTGFVTHMEILADAA